RSLATTHSSLLSTLSVLSLRLPPPPRSPLFPYTTLFRSGHRLGGLPGVALLIHGLRAEHRLIGGLDDAQSGGGAVHPGVIFLRQDRKSTRLNSSHVSISYAVFCLKKKKSNHRHQCAALTS